MSWNPPKSIVSENKKVGMFNKTVVILSIVVTLLAGTIPIYLENSKLSKGVSIELLSVAHLISKENTIKGLEVKYNNLKIEQLTQISYRFSNTGYTEILHEDIRIPLTIKLGDSKLINYRIDNISPNYLKDNFIINHKEKENNITLSFKDLKANESIRFSIFIDGKVNNPLDSYIRIKGISNLDKINHIKIVNRPPQKFFTKKYQWIIYVIWIFLFFFCLSSPVFWVQWRNQNAGVNNLRKDINLLDQNLEQLDYKSISKLAVSNLEWMTFSRQEYINSIFKNDELHDDIKVGKLALTLRRAQQDKTFILTFYIFLSITVYLFYIIWKHYN